MSQNSPAKHERIERHLMRQRGAGSRTVNADFGFSFAGLSAPTSQEATPSVIHEEPPAKRRRTIGQDANIQPQKAKTSALDRRENTKAKRVKRRFIADVDEETIRHGRRSVAGDDDSFVAGVGAKRQAKRRLDVAVREIQAESLDATHGHSEPTKATPAKAPRAPPKRKGGRKAKADDILEDTVDGLAGAKQSTTDAEQKPLPNKRAAAKRTAVSKDPGDPKHTMEELVEEAPSAPAAKPVSKVRRAATTTTQKQGLKEEAEPPESVEANEDKPKARIRARRQHVASEPGAAEPASEGHAGEESSGKPVLRTKIKRKKKAQQLATAEHHAAEQSRLANETKSETTQSDPHDIDMAQSRPAVKVSRKKTRQTEKASTRAPRKIQPPFVQGDDADDGGEPASEKESQKPEGKKRNVPKAVLEAIPPRLERRALQETDVNRSPLPRKSAEKSAAQAKDQRGESHSNVKRKRTTNENDSEPSPRLQRKSRKLNVQRDRAPDAAGDVQAAPEVELEKVDPRADAEESCRKGEDPPKLSRKTKARTATKSTHLTQIRPEASAEETLSQNVKQGIECECEDKDEDEDIDWLFTGPQTRPTVAANLYSAKPPPALSRKTRLADIDLDDLLASVAAFAQQ